MKILIIFDWDLRGFSKKDLLQQGAGKNLG